MSVHSALPWDMTDADRGSRPVTAYDLATLARAIDTAAATRQSRKGAVCRICATAVSRQSDIEKELRRLRKAIRSEKISPTDAVNWIVDLCEDKLGPE